MPSKKTTTKKSKAVAPAKKTAPKAKVVAKSASKLKPVSKTKSKASEKITTNKQVKTLKKTKAIKEAIVSKKQTKVTKTKTVKEAIAPKKQIETPKAKASMTQKKQEKIVEISAPIKVNVVKTTKKAAKEIILEQEKKVNTSLMIEGAKIIKNSFFTDIENDTKYFSNQKLLNKPTACFRSKPGMMMDGKSLVEQLSLQLELENKTYLEGCENLICVKCNVNPVDPKYYVDKFLGYCLDCAALLGLGQSKEGVFSDEQLEQMRLSMEKTMGSTKNTNSEEAISDIDDIDDIDLEDILFEAEKSE